MNQAAKNVFNIIQSTLSIIKLFAHCKSAHPKRQNASDQYLSSVAFEAISGHKDKKTLLIRKHFTDEQINVGDNFYEVVLAFLRQIL